MARRAVGVSALLACALLLWFAAGRAGDAGTGELTAPPGAEPGAAAEEPSLGGAEEGIRSSAAPIPECSYGEEPAPLIGDAEHSLAVLDTTYRLPADFEPRDLVEIAEHLAGAVPAAAYGGGHKLRLPAAEALKAMLVAAEAEGVKLAVQSAYRSYDYQANTFAYWVEVDGYERALRTSARAGHSEHQLGTVVDLRSRSGPPAWELADWAKTPEGAWVAANAHVYGFVMSYPQGLERRSCYDYEPWHYRFVGADVAAAMRAAGVTPREYLLNLAAGSLPLPAGESDL